MNYTSLTPSSVPVNTGIETFINIVLQTVTCTFMKATNLIWKQNYQVLCCDYQDVQFSNKIQ